MRIKQQKKLRSFLRDRRFHIDREPFYKEIKPTNRDNIPEATPRIMQLSGHRDLHPHHQFDRDLPEPVREQAEATPRVLDLARYDITGCADGEIRSLITRV